MAKPSKTKLRKTLLALREGHEKNIRAYRRDIAATIGEKRAVGDSTDDAQIDMSTDIVAGLSETHREALVAIDRALESLDAGTYGICQNTDCGKAIEGARLKALPFAQFCVPCQETIESGRAYDKYHDRIASAELSLY